MAIAAMVVTAASETAFPALLKPFFDNGLQANSDFQIWWVPAAVILLFIIRGSSGFMATYMMQWGFATYSERHPPGDVRKDDHTAREQL